MTIGVLNVMQDIADGASALELARRRTQAEGPRRRRAGNRVHSQVPDSCRRPADRMVPAARPATFAAASARTFELASICPQDSTEIVEFLMRLESPSDRIVAAVDGAVEWLRKVQLHGIRVKRVPAPVEEFLRHTADFDVVVGAGSQGPADLGAALRNRHRQADLRGPRRRSSDTHWPRSRANAARALPGTASGRKS